MIGYNVSGKPQKDQIRSPIYSLSGTHNVFKYMHEIGDAYVVKTKLLLNCLVKMLS